MNTKRKQALVPETFNFGAALCRERKAAGMSQGDLSLLMQTSKVTLGSWENNKSYPTQPDLVRLAEVLHVPVSVFFPESLSAVSAEDLQLLALFHNLKAVNYRLADLLLQTVLHWQEVWYSPGPERTSVLRESFTFVEDTDNPDELRAAAGEGAGYGFFPDRFSFVTVDERTREANILFTVAGRSMEPKFRDGDRVYVRRTDTAENGQIVLAYNGDDGFVIKLKKKDRLVSLNPDYPFRPAAPDQLRLFGVVTGKVKKGDFCSPEDEPDLKKIFEEDIRRYLQEQYGWEG